MSLFPFWVILGWFLFQFSSRIGRSNTHFCWVLQCHCRFRNRQQNYVVGDSEIGSQIMSLPIQKSTTKNYVAVDSEISNKFVLLPIQKSAQKNCVAAYSEISSQTMSLSIQKLATKNCVAVDSEIGNDGGVIYGFTFFGCLHHNLQSQLQMSTS